MGALEGGQFGSVAYGVSGDGTVIVGQSHSGQGSEAFRWTAQHGMVGLGDLSDGEFRSAAFAISDDGGTIVGQATGTAGPEACLWTPAAGMRSIHREVHARNLAPGWQLHEARGVSAAGRVVVGIGRNPRGETAAWLVTTDTP